MSFDANRIYELLPAIYRIRDAEQGEPLRALLSVIADQIAVLEEDLEQLYDDQFIETCADWAVPYIGDLIGYRALHGVTPRVSSPRAEVANTIAFRRRKGTAAMLEQLARDVTGWPARVVEFFELLGWTQYMNHLRVNPPRGGTLNLRDAEACERITYALGAFDPTAHTVDVRRIASGRGRYNIPNIGLFLWRLQAYPITRGDARQAEPGHYTFNPVGLDVPLFNQPQTETAITHLAEEINVPALLRRRPLHDELEARRQALADNQTPRALYFGDQPVLEIFLNGETTPVRPEEILICDLSDWRIPPASKDYTRADGSVFTQTIRVAADPVLGRMTFPPVTEVTQVQVNYAYGFSDDLGGGPYDRTESISAALDRDVDWQVGVSKELQPPPDKVFNTLAEAVSEWNEKAPGTFGVIAILDSRTYEENLIGDNKIFIPEGSRLLIVAAGWPDLTTPGRLAPEDLRPHLLGSLSVCGTAEGANPGDLILDGLLIEGTLSVLVGNLGGLRMAHCTLAPGKGSLMVNASMDTEKQNSRLSITLDHSICGPLILPDTVSKVRIVDSIVDATAEDAVAYAAPPDRLGPGAPLRIERSTIIGKVNTAEMELVSNSIMLARLADDDDWETPINSERRQEGCVRFSFLPLDSRTPRRHRCQPESEDDAARVRPQFTSLRYGDPGYGQLSRRCAVEIRQGADDEAEMGAFHDLFQPQRETNLRVRLDEYLRFGLEAGIFYVT
jgi:hypothetical protein